MKCQGSFTFATVNGLSGDPAILLQSARHRESMLFDLGDLNALPPRALLKTRIAGVSHTHLDHFIGFDRWLRAHVPLGGTLRVCGPPGISTHVAAKMGGYIWNLLDAGHLELQVHEVRPDGTATDYSLKNENNFAPTPAEPLSPSETRPQALTLLPPAAPVATIPLFADGTRLEAVVLDHRTPCLAFAIQQPRRFQVRKDKLNELNLKPGPWIQRLQAAAAQGHLDVEISIANRAYQSGPLAAEIFSENAARPFAYVTDIGFTASNLRRLERLLRSVSVLAIETNYRAGERLKAHQRMHLTTRQAALIAAANEVGAVMPFHISNLYVTYADDVARETTDFFTYFKALTPSRRQEEIQDELDAVGRG